MMQQRKQKSQMSSEREVSFSADGSSSEDVGGPSERRRQPVVCAGCLKLLGDKHGAIVMIERSCDCVMIGNQIAVALAEGDDDTRIRASRVLLHKPTSFGLRKKNYKHAPPLRLPGDAHGPRALARHVWELSRE